MSAVFDAYDAFELDDGAFEPLLVRLIERQMGGASADEIIEYDYLIAALHEQLAAYGASEIPRLEYALLKIMMARIPASSIDCVYTALNGAVLMDIDFAAESP